MKEEHKDKRLLIIPCIWRNDIEKKRTREKADEIADKESLQRLGVPSKWGKDLGKDQDYKYAFCKVRNINCDDEGVCFGEFVYRLTPRK